MINPIYFKRVAIFREMRDSLKKCKSKVTISFEVMIERQYKPLVYHAPSVIWVEEPSSPQPLECRKGPVLHLLREGQALPQYHNQEMPRHDL